MLDKVKYAHAILGGRLISDPYPFYTEDSQLWIKLLERASYSKIGLYGALLKIRGIGATLVPSEKFGMKIIPLYAKDSPQRWGFPDEETWKKARAELNAYGDVLIKLLKEAS